MKGEHVEIAECELRIAEWGSRNADFGLMNQSRDRKGAVSEHERQQHTSQNAHSLTVVPLIPAPRPARHGSRTTNHGSTSSPQAQKLSGRTKPFVRKPNATKAKGYDRRVMCSVRALGGRRRVVRLGRLGLGIKLLHFRRRLEHGNTCQRTGGHSGAVRQTHRDSPGALATPARVRSYENATECGAPQFCNRRGARSRCGQFLLDMAGVSGRIL